MAEVTVKERFLDLLQQRFRVCTRLAASRSLFDVGRRQIAADRQNDEAEGNEDAPRGMVGAQRHLDFLFTSPWRGEVGSPYLGGAGEGVILSTRTAFNSMTADAAADPTPDRHRTRWRSDPPPAGAGE